MSEVEEGVYCRSISSKGGRMSEEGKRGKRGDKYPHLISFTYD